MTASDASRRGTTPADSAGGPGEPLSFGQQRMLMSERLMPGTSANNTVYLAWLDGPLDPAVLNRALTELHRRQAVLRTSYPDAAAVRVLPPAPVVPGVRDLSAAADPDAEAARLAALAGQEPFDLAEGAPVRWTLLRLGEQRHLLVNVIHHIAVDGWSEEVLNRELSALYRAFRAGRPSPLPEIAVSYTDYARAQHARVDAGRESLEYWRQRLTGAPDAVRLPFDRPPTDECGLRGATSAADLPGVLPAAARLAKEHRCSLFMILQAVYAALLARGGGQDDLIVGMPVAGRDEPEYEELVGFFINTVPVRFDLSGDPSLTRLLERVREATLDSYDHQYVPLNRVIEEVRPERPPGRQPLVQTIFQLHNTPTRRLRLDGLEVRQEQIFPPAAKLDLSVTVAQDGDRLTGLWEYREELFDAATIERMQSQYARLLTQALAAPGEPLSAHDLMTPAERHRVLVEWNATGAAFDGPATLDALVAGQIDRTPEAVAVRCDGADLTYRELGRRADAVAAALLGLGAGPDRIVGLCAERSFDLVVGALGILRAGAAYLPLDPDHPGERHREVLEEARPVAVLAQRHLAGRLPAGPPVLTLEDVPPATAEVPRPQAPGDSLAYVIYTSGSTGRPKGAMNTHRAIRNRLLWMQSAYRLGPDDAVLHKTPYGFDVSVWELFWPLTTGARLVVARPGGHREPSYLAELITAERVTTAHFVPSMLRAFLATPDAATTRGVLRRVVSSGEALPAGLARALHDTLPGTALHNLYGPTEAAVDVTAWPCAPDAADDPVPIGRPIANTRVHVLDDALRPVPPGTTGELYLGGANIGRGYLRRPGLTATRFVPDPFAAEPGQRLYRTGDLARFRPDGALEFLGRTDHQVKVRGHRVELGEIEARLLACPGVADAVVTVRDDAAGQPVLAAYWVPAPGTAAADRPLRDHLALRLPASMVPTLFTPLDAVPLNANGKADRARLPEPAAARPVSAPAAAPAEPATGMEKTVAAIWADVLGYDEIGVEDGFFDLGGHSLAATQVAARIAQLFPALPRRDLVRDLLRRPTVRRFTAALGALALEQAMRPAQAAAEPAAVPRLPRDVPLPLSMGQRRMWFLDQLTPGTAEYLIPIVLRLRGPLDEDALGRALTEIVRRHEILRTRVDVVDDVPVGRLEPATAFRLRVRDVSGDTLDAALREEAGRPLDLTAEPPLRGVLLRVDPATRVLCLTVHHIAFDAWSHKLLYAELGALYTAFSSGAPTPLPPVEPQYADVTAHQESLLTPESLAADLEFWRGQLDGLEPFELPTDLPRPAKRSALGASCSFDLPPDVLTGLDALARGHRTTLFITLLAACQALLHRYTGREDITLGTTATERDRRDTEGLIGLFINMLVLPGRVSGHLTFAELLDRTRDTALDLYRHQALTFDRLVEELAPERDLSRTPLFQIMMKLDEGSAEPPGLPGVEVADITEQAPASKYDLSIEFVRRPGALRCEIEYDTALYLPATGRALARHLEALLRQVAADPGRLLAALDLVTGPERAELAAAAGPGPSPYPDGALHEVFERQARLTPDAVAVTAAGEPPLSYAALDAWAEEIAARLTRHGALPDRPVGLLLDRSPAMVAALLGILKAGCAYLPIETDTPEARVARLLADSGATACLCRPGLAGLVTAAGVAAVSADRDTDAGPSAARRPVPVTPDHLAAVYYTSGSTGRPKGVACTHGGWVNRMWWMQRSHQLRPGEAVLHKTTLTFDDAGVELFWPLLTGGTVALLPPGLHRDPRAIIDAAVAHRAVHVQFVPSMLDLVLDALTDADLAGLAALRTVLSSGEALRPDLVRRFHERFGGRVALENTWGATEVSIDSTRHLCVPDDAAAASVPIGRAIDNNTVHVLDEHFQPLPFGVTGELYIGGDGLARGYLGDPARTAAAFVPHPYLPGARLYRTGDWGRTLHDGTLVFASRRDDQVKVRGVRIELGEVEAAVRSHPAVADAAVVTWEATPGDKRLAAYVVPRKDTHWSQGALRDHLRATLPGYALPGAVVELDTLPRTASGKLDRRALPAPTADSGHQTDQAPPDGPTEEAVAGIWADVLGVTRLYRHDDFFALGGHSLLATRATSRMRKAFSENIPLSLVFEHPTPAAAARHVERILTAEIEEMSEEEVLRMIASPPTD